MRLSSFSRELLGLLGRRECPAARRYLRARRADAVEVRKRDRDVLTRGRSTPAIRAMMCISSTLPLLVAGVFADDAHDALAADDLALVANLLDARTNLHDRALCRLLACRVRDSSPARVER